MKTQGFLLKYPDGKSEINPEGNLSTKDLTAITWQELKDKRDAGKLTPGALYRITDYNCTTTQENTKSAGHLFDIILLALSENKLAEEGWAMEHPTDIYTTICTDGVEFKTAFYSYIDGGSEAVDVVDINSLKAQKVGAPLRDLLLEFEIFGLLDTNTKTIHMPKTSTEYIEDFTKEDAIYNYFQNSNLSAWKVWYCLDNDKNRFAWADDNTTQSIILNNGSSDIEFERFPEEDVSELIPNTSNYFTSYAWRGEVEGENYTVYTMEECPTMYSRIYMKNGEGSMNPVVYIGIVGMNGFGRGVIYRLIDEFNNDCPYDFKNILHIINVKFEDPVINYTFYNSESRDSSMNSAEIIVYNNYISPITETFENESTLYIIPTITIGETSNNNRIYGKNIGLVNAKNVVLIGSSDLSLGSILKGVGPTIYIGNAEIVGSLSSISDENIGGGAHSR